jgi:DtxR family Mn-dependent transcriptional regulator
MPDPLIALAAAAALAAAIGGLVWLVPRWRQGRETTERVLSEDALKHIHKFDVQGQQPTMESVAGVLNRSLDDAAELLAEMEQAKLLQVKEGAIHLTPRGRATALHIIRAHRLWGRYLAEETGFTEADWHGQAERYEHQLSPADADVLAAQLGNPTHDPHGDPIPTAEGDMVDPGGVPLSALPVDAPARIVHLEDEPGAVYAQIVALGLNPGMLIRVLESTPDRIRFWADGNEHVLAPIVATNVTAELLPAEALEEPAVDDQGALSALAPGEAAEVVSISRSCRGAERRRFMDLGILPGTPITAEIQSPSGDPTAYRIRGALIALRRDQADMIHVRSNLVTNVE